MTGGTGAEKTITTFRPHKPELLKFNICFLFFSNLISNKKQMFEYLSAAPGRRVIIVCYSISRDGEIGKRCRGRPGETVQSNSIRGRDCDPWLLLQVRVLFTQTLGRVAVSLPVPKQKLLWHGVCRRRFGTSGGFFSISSIQEYLTGTHHQSCLCTGAQGRETITGRAICSVLSRQQICS